MPEPWEGTSKCQGATLQATRCSNLEIEGLGFCFPHVPLDMRDEAQDVTGLRYCVRQTLGDNPRPCSNAAEPGGLVCSRHGGQVRPQAGPRGPAVRHINAGAADELAQIMSLPDSQQKILAPELLENPYEELLAVAAEIKALKELLKHRVASLQESQWRWQHTKAGEQISAWVLLYERSLERLASILVQIIKLNIEERLARIDERQADLIERAFKAAMAKRGLDLELQDDLRQEFGRQLQLVS